jgi:multidrug efflux pump subunit AcrB
MNAAIAWFARNHVAANLLMFGILVGGLLTVPTIKQTVMPDFELNYIAITVVYPGASPEEIEKSVTIRIEEAIEDVAGIEEITSTANEGATRVIAELEDGADLAKVLNEIESRVDGIDTFPQETEEPIVTELQFRMGVMDVAIHGPVDERSLKMLGQQVRDELARLPGISQVELAATRPYEISIEVSEAILESYGLRFDDVVRAVRRTSVDLPGGSVRTRAGEILLRTDNQAYFGSEFEAIPLLTREDGSRVTLGQVARVIDGFEENPKRTTFDGDPAVFVQVYRVGDQQALVIAEKVHAYLENARRKMPEGVELTVWADSSQFLGKRIEMMLRNAQMGFVLVILLLALFLKLHVAFWVAMGLPISMCGALMVMPWFEIDINMLTVFSFIMALGILVDDAIVTGENIYTRQQRDPGNRLESAIRGTQEVAVPVVFGVLTTVAAFVPFALIEGHAQFMAKGMGGVMCAALIFSLIESKLVLPSHLSRGSGAEREPRFAISRAWARVQRTISDRLGWVVERAYTPAVERAIEWRYLTLAISAGIFIITFGMVNGGCVKSVMQPATEAENVFARLTMPLGTPVAETEDAIARLGAALDQVRAELETRAREGEPPMVSHVLTMIGAHRRTSPVKLPGEIGQPHLGQITIELSPSETRSVGAMEIASRWRELTGSIPGVEELVFSGKLGGFGAPIDIDLRGEDLDELESAASIVADELALYPGVADIRDSHREGKQQLKIRIRPEAEAVGLSVEEVGRQIRQAFHGAEAQRIQRGQDEVKVMVRYPEDERRSLSDVEALRIRLPDGTAVPIASVADAELGRGAASLLRAERQRRVRVRADVDETISNSGEIAAWLESELMPSILARHPGIDWKFEGEQGERRKAMGSLSRGFVVALLVIFVLIAVPLRSYLQAIVIMLTIPFGYVGAVLGHLVWGWELSFLSYIGMMACAGVVVNDSLVLVTFLNRMREEGYPLGEAAVLAGRRRFRPIILTSVTTFAGLLPIMLETSAQAQFVIPMAISLSYGVLVATVFTLLMIPAAMVFVDDLKRGVVHVQCWLGLSVAESRTPRTS